MDFIPVTGRLVYCATMLAAGSCAGCTDALWNNPYPAADAQWQIYYDSFSERPKHLDPARAYSSDEYQVICQIYEPPLQYHFLRRPYTLVPLSAAAMPQVDYLDQQGRELSADAASEQIAYSRYRIRLRLRVRYQPHPALARDGSGAYLYHALQEQDLEAVHTLRDFPEWGSRELLAEDYVHQVKRLAHPALHSPIAGLMGRHIVGFADLSERLQQVLQQAPGEALDLREYSLQGVRVLGRHSYEILLHGKYPQFLYWLAMPFFAPMPWEADHFYAQAGMQERNLVLDWYPIGTGPFLLRENNPSLRMVLERNVNFRTELYPSEGEEGDQELGFLRDAGLPLPFLERAVYSLEKEAIPAWNKFLQGYYDTSGLGSDSFDQAITVGEGGVATLSEAMRARGMHLVNAVAPSIYYMGFNMKDAVIGGLGERARKLRQAISIALNYEEFISIFLNGRGVAAQAPLPPGLFGHREGRQGVNTYTHRWRQGGAQRRPIEDARQLLAEAGYPLGVDAVTGKPLVLYFDTVARGPDSKAQHAWLVKQFAALGIQLVIRGTDYNRFREKVRKGTAQIFQWGWNADYPDPENFLFLLYGKNSKVDFAGENASNYQNPEFDRLFEQMRYMENGPGRGLLIDQIVSILQHDAPWVWGFHPQAFSLHHAWYRNAKPHLMANNTLKYKRIDPQLRARLRVAWNQPLFWPFGALALLLALGIVLALRVYHRRERSAAL